MTADVSKDMVKLAYKAMDDKKAVDISVLDISNISVLADYFIIASGTNVSQIDAITNNVMEALSRHGYDLKRSEGISDCGWILMDFGDIIVHVFSLKDRQFYDLDAVWSKGIPVSNVDEL